jgi:hypothetical protein
MAITTQLPYVAPKRRKPETARYVVKWIVADTMYFQWFKRDSAAVAFLNRLTNDGIEARVLMK